MKTIQFTKFVIVFLTAFFGSVLSYADEQPAIISVTGNAEVSVDPNMIVIQVESWGKAAAAEEAQSNQAEQFKKLKSAIEKFKIAKEDFKTINYSIFPEYFYDQKSQTNKITSYKVSHQISITLKKIDQAGNLIDAITSGSIKSNSGLTISSISWDSNLRADFEKQAMETAVQKARSKAEILANASNVKIKRVFHVTYNPTNDFSPPPQMEVAQMKAMARSSSTELTPGQIKLSATVSMDFEIQ